MSSSFRRIISQLSSKLPRSEDRKLLDKLADDYERGGSDEVKEELERMLESVESE
jgi:hypothetical protein